MLLHRLALLMPMGTQPLDLFVRVSRFMAMRRKKAVGLLMRGGCVVVEEIKIVFKYPSGVITGSGHNTKVSMEVMSLECIALRLSSRVYSHDWTECPFLLINLL